MPKISRVRDHKIKFENTEILYSGMLQDGVPNGPGEAKFMMNKEIANRLGFAKIFPDHSFKEAIYASYEGDWFEGKISGKGIFKEVRKFNVILDKCVPEHYLREGFWKEGVCYEDEKCLTKVLNQILIEQSIEDSAKAELQKLIEVENKKRNGLIGQISGELKGELEDATKSAQVSLRQAKATEEARVKLEGFENNQRDKLFVEEGEQRRLIETARHQVERAEKKVQEKKTKELSGQLSSEARKGAVAISDEESQARAKLEEIWQNFHSDDPSKKRAALKALRVIPLATTSKEQTKQ